MASPAAGFLSSLVVVFAVQGLEPGVYHYDVGHHGLELVRQGDFRQEVFQAAVVQEMLLGAGLALVLTAIFPRVQWKYTYRSYRYLLLEAGHLGHNVYLSATSMGLGCCAIGAFFDDQLNGLLGVDGQAEAVVYLMSVGAA